MGLVTANPKATVDRMSRTEESCEGMRALLRPDPMDVVKVERMRGCWMFEKRGEDGYKFKFARELATHSGDPDGVDERVEHGSWLMFTRGDSLPSGGPFSVPSSPSALLERHPRTFRYVHPMPILRIILAKWPEVCVAQTSDDQGSTNTNDMACDGPCP